MGAGIVNAAHFARLPLKQAFLNACLRVKFENKAQRLFNLNLLFTFFFFELIANAELPPKLALLMLVIIYFFQIFYYIYNIF